MSNHGAVIVNMLKPNGVVTLQEYQDKSFSPFIGQQLSSSSRIDIVWNVYAHWNHLLDPKDQ